MQEGQFFNGMLTGSLALLLGLLMLTPLVISPGVFAHFSVSKAIYARSIIEVLLVVWALLMLRSARYRPGHSWVILALLAYSAASVLAAIWGINQSRSVWSTFDRMTGVFDLLHWSLLALILSSVIRSSYAWRLLLNGQLVVTLLLALTASTQVWGVTFIPSIVAKCRVDATLGNASYLAPILVTSILVSAALLAQSYVKSAQCQESAIPGEVKTAGSATRVLLQLDGAVWRILWLSVVGLGSLVLVYTGTRGALIGLAAGAVAMPLALAIWGNRRALVPVGWVSGVLLLTVGAIFLVDSAFGLPVAGTCENTTATARLTELAGTGTNDSTLALRLSSARAGYLGFLERPILGWGPENFAYAYDQYVDPQIFRQGSFLLDKAHNQVVEEFTTKGLIGGIAFLAMWCVLARAVISYKRPVKDEILSYGILGALGGYFVQNLFLFDTPSSLLYWVVLVAWVAWREKEDRSDRRQTAGVSSQTNSNFASAFQPDAGLPVFQRFGPGAMGFSRFKGALPVALVAGVVLSLYWFSLQPYLAARNFGQTSQRGIAYQDRLNRAQESFKTFPPMANQTRRLMTLETLKNWRYMDDSDQQRSKDFFGRELGTALGEDSRNAAMLIATILFFHATVESADVLAAVNPLLSLLHQIAPNRVETHQLLAAQAVLEGRNSAALQIASEYQARAPGTENFFTNIESVARENLATSRD